MRDVLRQLLAAIEAQRPIAGCRLFETRGSTPQKAGAAMLVYEDGSQAGTLGGGCVEAEVKRRALALLADKRTEVSTFQLDSDYGWDDGLICGGRMQVLIEPIVSADRVAYYRRLANLILDGQGCTEAIVFDQQDSGVLYPASLLFDAERAWIAALHVSESFARDLASRLGDQIRPLSNRPRPHAALGIAFLPTLPRCRLVIVGGGHVGKAVGDLAADLEFDIWIVDDRQEFVAAERFPRAERRLSGQIDRALPDLQITPNTYCLIVTRGHSHDQEALFHLASRGARYVGLIGSRRKI